MKNILVVDDDPTFLALISELLESEGFEVTSASTHDEALKSCERDRFDLILCDLVRVPRPGDRPGTNWMETIEALTFYFRTPLIVVSGFVPDMPFKRLEERGVVGILPKPFGRAELLREVNLALDTAANQQP